MKTEFIVQRDPIRMGARLYIREGSKAVTLTATTKEMPEGMLFPEAAELHDDEAQSLLDALWTAGYRPNSGQSSLAHIEAMRDHLNDMRRLVFKGKE